MTEQPKQQRTRKSSKPYYSAYAEHMWNFYLRRKKYAATLPNQTAALPFRSDVDRLDYEACDRAYRRLTDAQKKIVDIVHCSNWEEVRWKVTKYAELTGQTVNAVWRQENEAQRIAAVERGLLAERR